MTNLNEILGKIGPNGSFARGYWDLPYADRCYWVNYTIGYMLMVMRNKPIRKFSKEFAAIRHGDYDEFYKLMGNISQSPLLSIDLDSLEIKNSLDTPFLQKNNDCDFAVRTAITPAVKKFLKECYNEYGSIIDKDEKNLKLGDLYMFNIYCHLAAFEGSIRMIANNYNLIKNKGHNIEFETVLSELMNFKQMTAEEKNKLNKSRQFLNKIKHKPKKNITMEEIENFVLSYNILINYGIANG